MWKGSLLVALTLLFTGCSVNPEHPAADSRSNVVSTLTVYNETGGMVDVYTQIHKIGTAIPGTDCLEISRSDLISGYGYLVLQPTAESKFRTDPADLETGHWQITISAFPNKRAWDRISLYPASRCDS